MRLLFLTIFLTFSGTLLAQDLQFLGKELKAINKPNLVRSGGEALVFAAGAETDLYFRPGVNYKIGNAPMYLFRAADDFVLEAQIKPDFKRRFDGGFLVVYQDINNWGKFGFQEDQDGKKRAVSVITNKFSDQSNSLILKKSSNFFKLEKTGTQLSFYVKKKEKSDWILLRQLLMPDFESDTHVGFMVQSPMGEGCKVLFSEIKFWENVISEPKVEEPETEDKTLNKDEEIAYFEPKGDIDLVQAIEQEMKVSQFRHVVKKGETYFGISQAYGMPLSRLLKINGTSADEILPIGKELLVEARFKENQIHVVERGDTLYSISKKYGIELDNLMKRNGLEGNLIDVGQTLLVAY